MKKLVIFMLMLLLATPLIASEKGSMMETKGSGYHDGDAEIHQKIADLMNGATAMGVAHIKGTTEGSGINGWVKFFAKDDGVHVLGHLMNVSPGKHGIHVHQNGSCEDGGKAAGGHFNPHGVDHGHLPNDGKEHAHLGDMGNVEVNEEGFGLLEVVLPGVGLEGDEGLGGRAVILHEKEDDFGQPTGNAGPRIGCGIINTHPMMKESMDEAPKGSPMEEKKGSPKGSY